MKNKLIQSRNCLKMNLINKIDKLPFIIIIVILLQIYKNNKPFNNKNNNNNSKIV